MGIGDGTSRLKFQLNALASAYCDLKSHSKMTSANQHPWQSWPIADGNIYPVLWMSGLMENPIISPFKETIHRFLGTTQSHWEKMCSCCFNQRKYSIALGNTSYNFSAIIDDAPLSVHVCEWNISGLTSNLDVNLTAFTKDSQLPISVTCTDEGGLNGSFQHL